MITRFNVLLGENVEAPSDEWLHERLELFKRYTVRSITSQTVPPDDWLVLCGPSPDWFRDEMRSLGSEIACLTVVYTNEVFSPQLVGEVVRAQLSGETTEIITTRLDNDDAISTGFLEALRRGSLTIDSGFVNITHGLQIQSGRIYHRSDPSNAFASLIETVDHVEPPRTIFLAGHDQLPHHGQVHQLRSDEVWLQVVHGSNIANAVRGVRANPAIYQRRFAFDLELDHIARPALLLDQLATSIRLGLRVIRRPSRLKWLFTVLKRPGASTHETDDTG